MSISLNQKRVHSNLTLLIPFIVQRSDSFLFFFLFSSEWTLFWKSEILTWVVPISNSVNRQQTIWDPQMNRMKMHSKWIHEMSIVVFILLCIQTVVCILSTLKFMLCSWHFSRSAHLITVFWNRIYSIWNTSFIIKKMIVCKVNNSVLN